MVKSIALAVVLLAASFACALACASGFDQSDVQELKVSASFASNQSVAPNDTIELRFSRPIKEPDEKPAVFIGQMDLTGLFTINETGLRYDPKLLPLPEGEMEVVIYLVSPSNEWREIARLPLRVLKEKATEQEREVDRQTKPQANDPPQETTAKAAQSRKRFGFEKFDITPSLTLGMKSQPTESHFPDSNRPQRPIFTDITTQGSFRSDIARGGFNSQAQFDVAGSSFRGEALRFAQVGDAAPRIDLASYLMQFQQDKARFLVGHTSFGASRHLMNNISSRGLTLALSLPRFDLSLGAMNGTSIVGFDNFFGISRRKHQMLGGALGIEMLPARPGTARVEVGALNGWLQPVNNFNQANVNDAERSRGFSFRFVGSDPAQRLRVDAGFTRSQFINPSDPLLNQGNDIEPIPAVTRNARYLDGSYDLLKNFALSDTKSVNVTLAFRHERVDPLFRSLGAITQADRLQNEFQASGTIGEITAQYSHLRFNDNLSDIPSILKSLTRRNAFALGVPMSSLLGNTAKPSSPLLPRLAYAFDRTQQFGASIPVRGGFELNQASIPDLIATNQTITADWQIQQWRIGYRINHSLQNNRQTNRQAADLITLVNTFAIGVTPDRAIDLNLDLNIESAENKESRRIDRLFRFSPVINWRMTSTATLSASLAATLAGDAAGTSRNRNAEFDLQWSYRFGFERDRFRKVQSQFFVRYANRYAHIRDTVFATNNLTKLQTFNTGLSFTFF